MPRLASRRSSALLTRLGIVLMLVPAIAGCRGCGSAAPPTGKQAKDAKDAAAKKAEEEAKNKTPIEADAVTPLLSEPILATDAKGSLRLAKPGHWTATVQKITANNDNFEGRTTIAPVTRDGDPIAIPDTDFAMTSSRPALLAKGRAKRVLNEMLLPEGTTGRLRVKSELTSGGGAPPLPRTDLWTLMPANQYFFVVLAREPARYAFLKVADAVRAPSEDSIGDATPPHYRIVLADGDKPVPLPTSALTWTSVAYVVWDQVNLAQVTPEQQQALVDWIHWGGRLIINGPDSLAALRGTFLDKHLPVDAGKAIAIDDADLDQLNAYWGERTDGKALAALTATRPWSGVELTPRKRAGIAALPGAEGLFYEGPVGSGSIVVSAVQLTERDLLSWPGFDGFLNGALLRRPARRFREEVAGQLVGLQTIWANPAFEGRQRDAHFTTPLRWFARDAGAKANTRIESVTPVVPPGGAFYGSTPIPEEKLVVDRPSGLGGWNEYGLVSEAARSALRTAAGIRVPAATFVIVRLAVYLIILVPLNWMMFTALGRVEWAWIAAPIIALAGTVAVVRQAQLDIGFVRSQTEIALLELQGDLPRGDLNRYFALYSSLSTTYDAEFDGDTAVATPFPADRNIITGGIFERKGTVEFEKYDHPRLRGVPVTSASTQLIHSEQFVDLAGPLRLTSPPSNPHAQTVENLTGFDLADATVIHRRFVRDNNGRYVPQYQSCWLGDIRQGTSTLLALQPATPTRNELLYADKRAESAKLAAGKRLDVDELLKLAFAFAPPTDPLYAAREEYRLVARIDQVLPGASTDPAASQTTGATVVLAHLQTTLGPAPTPDVNSRADMTAKLQRDFDEEGEPEDN
jgi:hypothetical protein